MYLRRFVEYEYMKRKILNNSEHLTEQQVTEMLDDMNVHWDDLTFRFIPHSTGFKTKIYCNNSDEELSVDDLNPAAMTWYIKQLKDLTLKRIQEQSNVAV